MAHPQHAIPLILPDGEVRAIVRAPLVERLSWALYDFSNTIFSMNVATLYFAVWLVSDLGVSNTMDAVASAVASALVVLAIPFLGALSDARRRRKPWVVGFTVLSCVACAMMGVLGQRLLPLTGTRRRRAGIASGGMARERGAALLGAGGATSSRTFAYQAAQPFYNAMMPELVPVEEQGRLSGFGTAIGYVGSIVGVLLVHAVLQRKPSADRHAQRRRDGRASLVRFRSPRTAAACRRSCRRACCSCSSRCRCSSSVATTIPRRAARRSTGAAQCARSVTRFATRKQHPGALRFIIASFVYQDAIGTIVGFMTLYAVKAVGFDKGSEITLFLVLTVPSIFGSYIYGYLVDRLGAKRSLMMTLVLWIVSARGHDRRARQERVLARRAGDRSQLRRGSDRRTSGAAGSRARRRGRTVLQPDASLVARRGDRRSAHLGSHRRRTRVVVRHRDRVSGRGDDGRGHVRHRGAHSSRRSGSLAATRVMRVRAAARDRRRRAALVLSRHPGRGPRAHSATSGPVLLVVNHPNALVDALLVAWVVPRRVLITAKIDAVRESRWLARLLRWIGVRAAPSRE